MSTIKKLSLRKKIRLIILGFLSALIILELGLRLIGFFYILHDKIKNQSYIIQKTQTEPVRIICLGACYTVGVGAYYQSTYPYYIGKILRANYKNRTFKVINGGIRGKNFSFFVNNLPKIIKESQPDVLILNINGDAEIGGDNLILANEHLFSSFERLRIKTHIWLNNLKVYKIAMLIINKNKRKPNDGIILAKFMGKSEGKVRSISNLEKLLNKDPSNAQGWSELAEAYSAREMYKEAVVAVQSAILNDPKQVRYYIQLFNYSIYSKDYELTLEAKKKILQIIPELHKQLRSLNEQLYASINRSSKPSRIYFQISGNLAFLGEYQKALEMCDEARKRTPTNLPYRDMTIYYKTMLGKLNVNPIEATNQWNLYEYSNNGLMFLEQITMFVENRSGKKNDSKIDSNEIFYRWLKYDLSQALRIADKYDIKIILENTGSSPDQQEVIKRVHEELNIPLVDIYGLMKNAPDRKKFVHPYLVSRLSKEGNFFIAEEICKTLRSSGILDKNKH